MNTPFSDKDLFKVVKEQEITARDFGFAWESLDQILEQVQSEAKEIGEAAKEGSRAHLQEEIGDLLHASIAVAIFCDFDPKETLLKSIEKFQHRYDIILRLAKEDGYTTLRGQPLDVLMGYWNRSKNLLC